MSVIEGGRFDFDDGGSYVGEWCDGRAHGLGVATGPENQGEYSGEWVMGFESRGVYIWPSGNVYCGGWMKGKRHGSGVQLKGKWTYKGEFSAGFCGRYGVKESHGSLSRYEGSWHLNLFDGFGVETSGDGSTYSGAWSKGMRHGLGVRRSAPFQLALTQKDPNSVRAANSQSSLLSANESWDRLSPQQAAMGEGGTSGGLPNQTTTTTTVMCEHHRSGFVLIANSNATASGTVSNATGVGVGVNSEKKPSLRKTLFRKLRKQKSTGDLRSTRIGGSLRSTISTNSATSHATNHSLPDTLQVQTREILDPNTFETYWGQWKDDKRSGYGIAERSDGLRYEGEWYNNKKDGYGMTLLPNGSREEGRYKENVLVQALHKRNKLFAIRHSRLKDSIEEAVKNANDAATNAKDHAMETANQRAQLARNNAESAEVKGKEAQMLSNHAREVTKEFAPDFVQLGVMWLKSRSNIESKLGESMSPVLANSWLVMDTAKYCGSGNTAMMQQSRQQQHQQHSKQHHHQQQHQPHHHQQQQQHHYADPQLQQTYLNPDQVCLEVSGGSRRGSFRSSFRRSGDKKHNFARPQSPTSANDHKTYSEVPGVNLTSSTMNPTSNYSIQVPQINEPMIMVENKQQHLNLQAVPSKINTGNSIANNSSIQRNIGGGVGVGGKQSGKLITADQQMMKVQSPAKMYTGKLISPQQYFPQLHNEQITANVSSLQQPPKFMAEVIENDYPSNVNVINSMGGGGGGAKSTVGVRQHNDHYEHYGAAGDALHSQQRNQYNNMGGIEDEFSAVGSRKTIEEEQRKRRRSVPSIMTDKPVPASTTVGAKGDHIKTTAMVDVTNEDATRSSEFLNSTTSVYIIENGIRKRVQAEKSRDNRYQQQPPLSPKSRRMMDRNQIVPIKFQPEADELAPLPRNYRIESSSLQTRNRLEGSLPDVTLCDEIKSRTDTLMSRQEASQLSQQRRQQLLHEQERLRRGEIIIRMADLKDWFKQNYALVMIVLINFVIAILFLHILKK